MRLELFITAAILFCSTVLTAQTSVDDRKSNTYAVVIGISKYSSPEIPSLHFAHKDAEAFAAYLHSKAGGEVPADNIRLLVDSQATMAAILQSLHWLLSVCNKDDLVYIFFAGHGDKENELVSELGFLLTVNSPPNNYRIASLRIEDLNDYANTLSVTKQSKVVIITDACRSGKLADKHSRGYLLVGEALRAIKNKEVRIAACGANQLSNENEAWGGGRGVFSWYFVNGLKGMAEKQPDGFINAKEMSEFLDSSLKHDPFLKENNLIQTPILKTENKTFQLSVIDTGTLQSLKQQIQNDKESQEIFEIPEQPYNYFLRVVKEKKLLENLDYSQFAGSAKEDIPIAMVRQAGRFIDDSTTKAKFDELVITLKRNKPLLKVFTESLVEALHTPVSKVIQLLLKADEAELDKRRYYNAGSNNYDAYVNMLGLALKLSDSESHLFRELNVLNFYFTGLAARLKIPLVEKPDSLIRVAFENQLKALALEENMAYIYNELGLLYNLKKDYVKAKEHYMKAIPIAPDWSIPHSNLISVYTKLKMFGDAEASYQKAKELQPELEGIYFNYGVLNETKRNFLVSEEMYRKSSTLNDRDYLPFERLGFVYLHSTDYALADSFFIEAALRKRGFFTPMPITEPEGLNLGSPGPRRPLSCLLDKSKINDKDLLSYFAWAQEEELDNRNENAISLYKKIILQDKRHFLAFHYLGKVYEKEKKYKEAEIMYSFAVRTHMDSAAFSNYLDSLSMHGVRISNDLSLCLYQLHMEAYYDAREDHYLLGDLYAKWNHFDDAVKEYNTLIQTDPRSSEPRLRLAKLYEEFERYEEAENLLLSVVNLYGEIGQLQLGSFYVRVMEIEPAKALWFHKAGSFFYGLFGIETYRFPADIRVYDDQSSKASSFEQNAKKWYFFDTTNLSERAIAYLLIADSLAADETVMRIDINDKLGDLYTWRDSTNIAVKHYEVATGLQPANAGTRMKLIDNYKRNWQNTKALQQLDSLNERREINFTYQLQLAKFYIHSLQFEKADKLLANADSIYPQTLSTITELKARRFMLSRQYEKAVPFYTELQQSRGDNRFILYSLARIHAFAGSEGKAMQYLLQACNTGFNYGYVLRYDEAWKGFANNRQWKKLVKKFPIME